MAEHKLCPEDITPPERQRVIKESTGVTSTKMSSPWAVQLSAIIGEHYCCRHYILNIKGRKIHEIGFVGLRMTTRCARWSTAMRLRASCPAVPISRSSGATLRRYSARCAIRMAGGSARGSWPRSEEQSAQHQEWGLVMVIPKPVQDVVDGMKKATYARPSTNSLHRSYVNMGYADGQKFDVSHRIDKTGRETET